MQKNNVKICCDSQDCAKLTSEFEHIAALTFTHLGLIGDVAIELALADKDQIQAVNRQTRGIDKATDVLSFPFLNSILPFNISNYPLDFDKELGTVFLGSIMLCDEVAKEQAQEYGHSLKRERAYLFLHGLLHLLGYDHMNDSDKSAMRQEEESILKKLNMEREYF